MTRTATLLAATSLSLLASACAPGPDRDPRDVPVGRAHALYADDQRASWNGTGARPLATTIWYPAEPGVVEEEWRIGVFLPGRAAPDAALSDHVERLPLVVMSHGTGGAAMQLSWLAERLAANGFLVAAVNHHGNTAAEPAYLPHGFVLWWERARDISVVIDRLLHDERFGARIDTTRIAVAGFSLGGYTALAVAGARTDRDQWRRVCAASPGLTGCTPPPEAPFTPAELEAMLDTDTAMRESLARAARTYRDDRVRAAFALAPGLATAFDSASLAAITIPVRIVVGDRDDQTPPDVHARPPAERIPHAELDILPGVGHYTFLSPCTLRGRFILRELCSDSRGIDRREVHRRVGLDAVDFLTRSLE